MLCWRSRGSGWAQVQNWNETLSGGARALHQNSQQTTSCMDVLSADTGLVSTSHSLISCHSLLP